MSFIQSGQVDSGLGYQGGQFDDDVQGRTNAAGAWMRRSGKVHRVNANSLRERAWDLSGKFTKPHIGEYVPLSRTQVYLTHSARDSSKNDPSDQTF